MITTHHKAHLEEVVRRDTRYAPFLRLPLKEVDLPFETACPFTRPPLRFDHTNLYPEVKNDTGTVISGCPGVRFNPSIIASGDGYLLSWRHGWAGCNIYACRLDQDFQPVGEAVKLRLRRKGATFGREDARWFRLNGKLHLSYTGVAGTYGPTNVLFARVNESTLAVEDKFHPKGYLRQPWEKNHAYFDHQGIAHAVYSIFPHKILRVEGNQATVAYETKCQALKDRWTGGRLCGGASPVLHKGLWYHFFHGSTEWNGRRQYNFGLACYLPEPPFEIVRFTPHPLDVADVTQKHDHGSDVLFPGGAVYLGKEWVIAAGAHDRWSELRYYSAEWVEAQLEDVT
jgi:predicted GH43/DUF377 family glycosyl hydrolase